MFLEPFSTCMDSNCCLIVLGYIPHQLTHWLILFSLFYCLSFNNIKNKSSKVVTCVYILRILKFVLLLEESLGLLYVMSAAS